MKKSILLTTCLCFLSLTAFAQWGNNSTTYTKDAWGNTVKKDQYGNTQGTYSKDAWGNTIYTPNP